MASREYEIYRELETIKDALTVLVEQVYGMMERVEGDMPATDRERVERDAEG